jgi:hypothetical protein
MKVGDLVECDQYGTGIIIRTIHGNFMAYFCEVGKKGWFSADHLGDSMELVSEGR